MNLTNEHKDQLKFHGFKVVSRYLGKNGNKTVKWQLNCKIYYYGLYRTRKIMG